MRQPPRRTVIALPPREDGDLRAFARAIVALARRLAQEEQARQPVVQSEPLKQDAT